MYIRWQSRKRDSVEVGPHYSKAGKRLNDVHWSAVLVESERVNGKPTQRHVAHIVGFTESAAKHPVQRCYAWDRITDRLDSLHNQITAAERKMIEAVIAKKLPRPSPAKYKDIARETAQKYGWDFLGKKQREVLRDEADTLQGKEGDAVAEIKGLLKSGPKPVISCSFCGKPNEQVEAMITGPPPHNICNECVERAVHAIEKSRAPASCPAKKG